MIRFSKSKSIFGFQNSNEKKISFPKKLLKIKNSTVFAIEIVAYNTDFTGFSFSQTLKSQTQNPVSARTCRFDPGRRYSLKDKVSKPCLLFFPIELLARVT